MSSDPDLDLDLVEDLDCNQTPASQSTKAESSEEDNSWIMLLEDELDKGCDFGKIRQIAGNRPLISDVRVKAWQVLLGVSNKGDPFLEWDGLYNLPCQADIRRECQAIAAKFGNGDGDRVGLVSDLESVLTLYSQSREMSAVETGWSDILQLLLVLNLPKAALYNTFFSLTTKYIPRGCVKDGRAFDLFRLLLLYHDPHLCAVLDTHNISPHLYAETWFTSLFSAVASLEVGLRMWDVYLQQADPFLVFFLALVILINAKEMVMEFHTLQSELGKEQDKSAERAAVAELIQRIRDLPSQLSPDDIDDFCQLAAFYSSKTPQSFRRDYHGPLFGSNLAQAFESVSVHQLICLPVSVQELLQSNKLSEEGIHYFVVDTRPMAQYVAGHFPGAFNLDASLIVNKPGEFGMAVQSLGAFKAKTHPLDHLCFMGSGREEEDQFLHMLLASFLQKGLQHISLARGGYAALHSVLREALSTRLSSHSVKACLQCKAAAAGGSGGTSTASPEKGGRRESPLPSSSPSLLSKGFSLLREKGSELREKVVEYAVNADKASPPPMKHAAPKEREKGKRYRGIPSAFSIASDDDDSSGDEDPAGKSRLQGGKATLQPSSAREKVRLKDWLAKQPDITATFDCHQLDEDAYMYPGHLALSRTHLFILREVEKEKGMAWLMARRPLANVVKITSKKRIPELLTLRHGFEMSPGQSKITGSDSVLVPKAGDAAKAIKAAIMALQGIDPSQPPPPESSTPSSPNSPT